MTSIRVAQSARAHEHLAGLKHETERCWRGRDVDVKQQQEAASRCRLWHDESRVSGEPWSQGSAQLDDWQTAYISAATTFFMAMVFRSWAPKTIAAFLLTNYSLSERCEAGLMNYCCNLHVNNLTFTHLKKKKTVSAKIEQTYAITHPLHTATYFKN